ncbi:MAG: adventurous gliding motility protein CglE [Myxococcota bacterium]|nr:adventurous gliding motility protein CglE [Myxococcota bacterium]
MSLSLSYALLTSLISTPAMAQGIDGLDDPVEEQESARRPRKEEVVKEVNKGFYAKSSFGGAGYILELAPALRAGSAIGLAVGQDFVDQEKTSMAWEVALLQGVHNGCSYIYQADGTCQGGTPGPFIQGDTRTYSMLANYEFSKYPTRRIGLGVRAGGGVLFAPLLMDPDAYQRDVVAGEWGGNDGFYHNGAKPLGFGGVTFEYYSKLSHFSVGADADVFYAVNFDLGYNATGYFKYTF